MTIMAQKVDIKENWTRPRRNTGKESIHSGQFMVSDFEAEAQDDEDELAVPVPDVAEPKAVIPCSRPLSNVRVAVKSSCTQLSIETSLTKLFQCMSIAYRQKLTSPKWNRFKGVRLTWKDKIRLNNVIWRCWHMQFINKQNTLVCQFASPLDVDLHNKPEAIVLEGKYWKRKLHAVTAEYKKWRMFTHNQILGKPEKYGHYLLTEFDSSDWPTPTSDSAMMVDEDYMSLMSDTLFSAITGNVPFHFPDTREIARGANLADFIQPSLVQLQPSLDEFMDIEPLHDFLNSKLPPVPEELPTTISPAESYSKSVTLQGDAGQHQQAVLNQQAYQQGGSYPVWYIPPNNYGQQPIYQQPPPPPPPPPSHVQSVVHKDELHTISKPKLKHRSRSTPGISKKLATTSGTSPSSPLQNEYNSGSLQQLSSASSPSSQPQNSALLEQLLTSSTNNLYHFLESDSSTVTRVSSPPQIAQAQCVEVPSYLSTSFDQIENSQLLYQRQTNDIISSPTKSYVSHPEKNSNISNHLQLSPGSSENSSPAKTTTVLSPIATIPPMVNSSNSCPESPGNSQDQLSLSPLNVGSPSSPKYVPAYKEHRRVCHINAEQKRRCNIKNGFDTLHSLIPQLNQNPNAKMSKAAMLQKGADYIVQLRNERISLKQEMENLKQQIESLNSTICNCQSMLPVTGAPVSRHRSNKMKDMFKNYVRTRTNESWKFWILSLIFEPLLESFNNNVSTNSIEDLYQTTLQWVDQHCSLIDLRPVVLNALRHLCTTTEVLSDPARLPNEARAAVEKASKKSNREGVNSK
uniref:Basic helix-loop-helix zip transcription factor n=1 Tax=Riptortus pedestris TaxID=329032 RepID=R4WDU6_RIPPE|nr:basic helix-loop-helix zip transcription factor [Riptortus pedestris]